MEKFWFRHVSRLVEQARANERRFLFALFMLILSKCRIGHFLILFATR
jgi:hypothetical protein